jgi:hypothetical protein
MRDEWERDEAGRLALPETVDDRRARIAFDIICWAAMLGLIVWGLR